MASTGAVNQDALTPPSRAQSFVRRFRADEELAYLVTLTAAATIFLITALVWYELFAQSSLSRHKFGWSFLFTSTWDPIAGTFGALPFIYGTVVTSALALLIAVPQGLGTAIFLAEMAPPRISNALTFLIELLAAVPSVIYGLLGIFILVPFLQKSVVPALKAVFGALPIFQGAFYGVSIFSAGIVLSVMIMPFIVSVSREVLLSVPRDQREASLALGASQLADDVAGGGSECIDRHHGFHISSTRAGIGRDHGGHDGYREHACKSKLPCSLRVTLLRP